MKKSLAILLAFILTFSCISLLGTGTVMAEEVRTTIMQSDFDNGIGNWRAVNFTPNFQTEDGDTYITIDADVNKPLISSPFDLVPNNEYELTFELRIPSESGSFINGGKVYGPRFSLFETAVEASTGVAANTPNSATGDAAAANNIYAFPGLRRDGIEVTWEIGDRTPYVDDGTYFDSSDQRSATGSENKSENDPKNIYSDWTAITVKFTAVESDANSGVQKAAFAFGIDFTYGERSISVKNVKLVEITEGSDTVEPEEPEEPEQQPDTVLDSKASEVIVESDFSKGEYSKSNSATSRWAQFNSAADGIEYLDDDGDSVTDYARIKSSTATGKETLSSPTFELVAGKTYELSYYIRIPADTKEYLITNTTASPILAIYIPTGNTVAGQIAGQSYIEGSNEYAASGRGVRSNFTADWQIENYGSGTVDGYSLLAGNQYYNKITNLVDGKKKPNTAYANWTKVTATFTAIESNAIASIAFQQHASTTVGYVFDIKDVILKCKEEASAADLPLGTAVNNSFEDGKAGDVEAALAEASLIKSGDTGNNYLKYTTNTTTSKGVAVRFSHNKDYIYKISYDLNVFAKGSGELKTSVTKGSTTAAVSNANAGLVYNESGKATAVPATFGSEFEISSTSESVWQHVELELGRNADYDGSVKVTLLANSEGWEVGIDNLKVEMVSAANLEAVDDITKGTHAFNIRAAVGEVKQGLRFKSTINLNNLNLADGAKVVEYGTLVARSENKALLKREVANDMVEGKAKVIVGVAYSESQDINTFLNIDENGTLTYSGVLTNIGVENYDVDFSVCGYAVIETVSGARFTVYDAVQTISVYDAAKQISANPESDSDKVVAEKVISDYDAQK